ncbi:cytochrome c [Ideonella azotifigens]|uniref:Cytochrome c domain-containing protein n=2 Tax=Ideonella azotifigens TaxID=513160 RepID=A0ABN1KK49_9BURK|nr:cytochrome c [Ideonella azotifigens]MCD2339346.1 cytochrome c [Ideonella azotifigens]
MMNRLAFPLLLLAAPLAANADSVDPLLSQGWTFQQRDGAALYRAACQGCHMDQGQGAQGAGAYPALRGNVRAGMAEYVIHNVLHGRRAMPPVGEFMEDVQVAAVVNFVRQQFGPRPAAGEPLPLPVTAADVKRQR